MNDYTPSDTKQVLAQLKELPLITQCRDTHQQVSHFYSNLDPENFNFDTIESVDHEAIRKLIRTLETALVAYAKSRNKTGMKHDAAMYADQVAVFGKQHPAAPYANMEIRLRKLELLCLDTRRAELPMFQDFIASLEQQLAEAEQRWRKYFANCGAGLLTGP